MDEDKGKEEKPVDSTEPETDKPAESPKAVTGPAKDGLKKPLLMGLAALVLIGGAALAYTTFSKKDSTSTPTTADYAHSDTDDHEQEAEVVDPPEGYQKFEDATTGISFVYPLEWGSASLKQGEEERMDHLTAGSQKVITFSNNTTIVGGIMSNNWTHDPDMGHGGVGEPGAKNLNDAKDAKNHTNPANIYVDTDTQFAYIGYCADNCTSGDPRSQIVYTTSITGNPTYAVIQFIQAGDSLGSEYMTDGLVDYEKLDDADLTSEFPVTDARFVALQALTNSVKNL
jgi:hypothetical protein